jgi:hypothetical protein
LPDATIKKGNAYFDATLYTGNGTAITVTNSGGFAPDLVWTKARGTTTGNHSIGDTVRGTGKVLCSDLTNAEISDAQTYTAFNSNGFSYGNEVSGNRSGNTYVAWQWNAGGSNATNTSGTITSTVRANTTSGFSIVTYTGTGANATVGHGLGVAPAMVIIKGRAAQSTTSHWAIYHATLGNTSRVWLNLTSAAAVNSTYWNNTSPTSTTFSLGTEGTANESARTYVAYCFAPVAGYSAFGSYTGNGSTDGPFVYTGFRPRYVMVKRTDTTGAWIIWDSARDTYNAAEKGLLANSSVVEDTTNYIDFLSNGFKLRNTFGSQNASGGTYIYAAFAEVPTKFSLAR